MDAHFLKNYQLKGTQHIPNPSLNSGLNNSTLPS